MPESSNMRLLVRIFTTSPEASRTVTHVFGHTAVPTTTALYKFKLSKKTNKITQYTFSVLCNKKTQAQDSIRANISKLTWQERLALRQTQCTRRHIKMTKSHLVRPSTRTCCDLDHIAWLKTVKPL